MGGALGDAEAGMSGLVAVYATFADAEEAGKIARTVVEERLAACANFLGDTTSIYRWAGKIETAVEQAAIFKTTAALAPTLIARVAELHSYDVPAITVWPVERAHPAYAEWVRAEVNSADGVS